MSQDKPIFGIDLGTTFSAIAHVDAHGKPDVIASREGPRTTPSVIFFDGENPVVGVEASRMALIDPGRTVECIKREMGNPSYRFSLGGREYFPEELSALILAKLKRDAEQILGIPVERAVISVPAYFKDAQREATKQAGTMAGLEVVRIVNEPTAAALAYGVEKMPGVQTLLVYDFGGGTFDATVMKIADGDFRVLATDGDARLGGRDIDGRVAKWFAEEVVRERGVDLRLDPRTHQDLLEKAVQAKKDLSSRESTSATLRVGDGSFRVDLDRATFEDMIQDLVERTRACTEGTVKAAGLMPADIDVILLAGGSSRIPAVKRALEQLFGKAPAQDMNPDECVAKGAAIQAALAVAGSTGAPAPTVAGGQIVIHDVASHSLGVRALSADRKRFVNSVVIPRNTPVPCERTRTFTTNEDNQPLAEIEVLQGEDEDPRSPDVHLLGKAGLKDLPPAKAGELVIEVTLRYDLDGVVQVTASELTSGRSVRESVMRKASVLSPEVIREKKADVENAQL